LLKLFCKKFWFDRRRQTGTTSKLQFIDLY